MCYTTFNISEINWGKLCCQDNHFCAELRIKLLLSSLFIWKASWDYKTSYFKNCDIYTAEMMNRESLYTMQPEQNPASLSISNLCSSKQPCWNQWLGLHYFRFNYELLKYTPKISLLYGFHEKLCVFKWCKWTFFFQVWKLLAKVDVSGKELHNTNSRVDVCPKNDYGTGCATPSS